MTKKTAITAIIGTCLIICAALSRCAYAADITQATSSVSPHEVGVCAPNEPIAVEVDEDSAAPDEDEVDDVDTTEPDEPELTTAQKVAVNRDPDSDVWHDIDADQCPGHEWEYMNDGEENVRYCVNCGMVEQLPMPEEPDVDESEPVQEGTPDEDSADESDMEVVESDAE